MFIVKLLALRNRIIVVYKYIEIYFPHPFILFMATAVLIDAVLVL